MKLISEDVQDIQYLTESTETGKKRMYIEGTYMVGDQVNKNNRKYMMETLRKEVSRYTKEMIETNRAFGELNHPDTPQLNPERAAHRIISLVEDGNIFRGKSLVTSSPIGNIVKCLIEDGLNMGISSRALGSLSLTKEGYNLVQDDFRLITAGDIVADPSAPGAFVNGIMEGRDYWYDSTKGTWMENNYERLHDHVKHLPKRKLEEQALQLFDWYLNNLSRTK